MPPQALKTAGIYSFETLATADARKIESATGRNYPFGDISKNQCHHYHQKLTDIEETGNRLGKTTITVTLTRLSQAVRSSKRSCADMVPYLTLLRVIHPVRLLVSARAYQPWYSIFLSQQTSTSRAYQPRNQPANRLIECF